ncbi:MAG: hypothetical protein JWM41_296 [Gemmatimonadetes bacterium]|nr:hypothetical protein [Gemmatimonadota bacterium]
MIRPVGVARVVVMCVALVALAAPAVRATAQTPAAHDPAREEAVYAQSIIHIADSAIHRLDFFPVRAQVRIQMMFAARDSAGVLFFEIARRSEGAALVVDDIVSRFAGVRAPDDLRAMHAELVGSLRAARAALDRLSAAAMACQADPSTVLRCQTPFTSASTALGKAYRRYLDARFKIRDQITDTRTVLPEFKAPS